MIEKLLKNVCLRYIMNIIILNKLKISFLYIYRESIRIEIPELKIKSTINLGLHVYKRSTIL